MSDGTEQLKRCTKCGEEKPLRDFNKSKAGYGGYASTCRICSAEKQRLAYRRKVALKPNAEIPFQGRPLKGAPTLEYLREALHYDPETGNLSWRPDRPDYHFSSIRYRNVWRTRYSGRVIICDGRNGYLVFRLGGKTYYAHRVCFALIHGLELSKLPEQIDHKDTVRTNNRRDNLRAATSLLNSWNTSTPSSNTSGFKGVTWSKQRGKWRSTIQLDGKQKHLGFYEDPSEAHAAYVAAANDNFGEFARAA